MQYEIFLTDKQISVEILLKVYQQIFKISHTHQKIRLAAIIEDSLIQFYIETPHPLPTLLPGINALSFHPSSVARSFPPLRPPAFQFTSCSSLPELIVYFSSRGLNLKYLELSARKLGTWGCFITTALVKHPDHTYKKLRLFTGFNASQVSSHPLCIFSIDFRKNTNFLCRKSPKFLSIEKSLRFLSSDPQSAIMQVHTYPYLSGNYYLNLSKFDFYQHSLVLGSSGSGKTKFLSSFIYTLSQHQTYQTKYRVMVIDPHDSLRGDIGGLPNTKVYDYLSLDHSVNLFDTSARDSVVNVDTTLTLLKSLLSTQYNSKLERLARACIYLLIEKGEFNFANLRRLLTDPTYKSECLSTVGNYLPASIQNFFGQDYNQLRTADYDRAFAPLVSFIDELQLFPAFYRTAEDSISYTLSSNFLTIFSLNQSKLGQNVAKVIAGLLLNQLFVLMQRRTLSQHIILVIDEVAVVENPILARFLSEARKFNVSVILAGQYFGQISSSLRQAIFANTSNYFCFRVARSDAELLSSHLDMDISSNFQDDKIKLLSTLPSRSCVMRLSGGGTLGTGIVGRSLDFTPIPEPVHFTSNIKSSKQVTANTSSKIHLAKSSTNIFDIMRQQSTGRQRVRGPT